MPVEHLRAVAMRVDQHQLGRSAANVEHQGRIVARLDQRVAAEHRQPRLFLGRDDVEQDARFGIGARDEVCAVAGAAAGFRCDGAGQRDVAALQFVGADLERGDGTVDRRVAQPPRSGQPLTQPHDAREGVHHREAVTLRAGDQQAAIVGAEIEGGEVTRRHVPARAYLRSRTAPMPCRWSWPDGRGLAPAGTAYPGVTDPPCRDTHFYGSAVASRGTSRAARCFGTQASATPATRQATRAKPRLGGGALVDSPECASLESRLCCCPVV